VVATVAELLLLAARMLSGQTECAACHPAETTLHLQTNMAHAMLPALSSAFARHVSDHPLREAADGYEFAYSPVPTGLEVTAQLGKKKASGLMEWVLGSGEQGQTPVIRAGKSMLESRVSYFTRLNQFGITIGQPPGKSAGAASALGLKESNQDAQSCLACHATGVTKDLEPVIPGVQCERCHAGAQKHANDGKGVVINPGKLTARKQLELCGTCHRIKPPVDDRQPENVRFQPLRLMQSRCFVAGQLDCVTCHPAHRNATRGNAGFYNEKCNSCHGVKTAVAHTDQRRTGDCVGCHMPVVQLHPGLRFTDHYIRVASNKAGH
jgi:hypothetical protein